MPTAWDPCPGKTNARLMNGGSARKEGWRKAAARHSHSASPVKPDRRREGPQTLTPRMLAPSPGQRPLRPCTPPTKSDSTPAFRPRGRSEERLLRKVCVRSTEFRVVLYHL